MTIALPISAGRSGFTPDLALAYDSGNGNGPFGVGWRCELPSIGRKLDQRLPRYDDTDTFVLSGRDDLVPVPGDTERDGFTVQRYRSRTETSFERVERWTASAGDGPLAHDRHRQRDDDVRHAPRRAASATATASSPGWPAHGGTTGATRMVVDYVADDDTGIAMAAHERQRTPAQRAATRYLATVRYGNRRPNRDASGAAFDPATIDDWLFSVVFDYGDHDWSETTDGDGRRFVTVPGAARRPGTWPARPDPFSTYRAGFELRTYAAVPPGADVPPPARPARARRHAGPLAGADLRRAPGAHPARAPPRRTGTSCVTATATSPPRSPPSRWRTPTCPTRPRWSPPQCEGDDVCAAVLDPATIWTDLDGDGAAGLLEESAGALWYRRNTSPGAPTTASVRAAPAARHRCRGARCTTVARSCSTSTATGRPATSPCSPGPRRRMPAGSGGGGRRPARSTACPPTRSATPNCAGSTSTATVAPTSPAATATR